MWWPRLAIAVALCAAAATLGGCGFQPLYGGTTASGARLTEVMAGIDVNPIPGRVGQRVRNELIFENTGGGTPGPQRYRLEIAIRESVTDQLVQITGDATGQVYQLNATYKLIDSTNGTVVLAGTAISRAPYNRFQEIFANVRARYDAENRAARTVAESIKTRIASYLATTA
ncbi:LPS assembly lipoprotein LptE [Methyloceanibacter sp.]|uniref:LPS assembly lipoprotein LptE n=1 Tax=Methyloceanibacter sp. TaxID=1965321 RepID=UPI002D2ED5CC|nr:LPS assembly lipoprotein LptE [Methyloceanibacter sp.]HZP09761.1 LPS assembly lipoprotein LptE [Methyloceanibacter sp.]